MVTFNDKQVFFSSYALSTFKPHADKNNSWTYCGYQVPNTTVLLKAERSDIIGKINKEKTSLKKDSVLLFGKSSKFPRFKLANSVFKRCVKPGKQDFVIIDDNIHRDIHQVGKVFLVEFSNRVYLLHDKKEFIWATDHQLFKEDAEEKPLSVYCGNIVYIKKQAAEDVVNILNGNYKNLIYDSILDKAIMENYEVLTEDTINEIEDLLRSYDSSNKTLGLKVLSSFDVTKTPFVVNMLLGKHPELDHEPAFKSVGIKQMLQSIKWYGFPNALPNIYSLKALYHRLFPLSEDDKKLSRPLVADAVDSYYKSVFDNIISETMLNDLKISVTYEIK